MLKFIQFAQAYKASVIAFALALTSLSLIVPIAPAAAETLSIASAINKSGRQRMLSQRIVKAYCLLRLGVKPDVSHKILQDSVDLFEAQLIELRGIALKPALQQAWTKESEVWMQTRLVALETPDLNGAKKLNELSDQLLDSAQKLTQLLEAESGKKAGYWVNVSGRQRMLSQRIAKLFVLKKMGMNTVEVNNALEKAKADFLSAHEGLIGGAQNNPHIVTELRLAKAQWNYLAMALEQDQVESVESVATTSERILEIMDRVTSMFEKAYGD